MRRVAILFLVCFTSLSAHAATPAVPKLVVFFQQWSAALDKPALAVIAHASAYAKAHPDITVHVNAFADPTGSKNANILLTQLRAQVVMDQLQKDGVAASRLVGVGQGATQFALNALESRRVEIDVGH